METHNKNCIHCKLIKIGVDNLILHYQEIGKVQEAIKVARYTFNMTNDEATKYCYDLAIEEYEKTGKFINYENNI